MSEHNDKHTMNFSLILLLLILWSCITCELLLAQTSADINEIFDHHATGFALEGAHASVACESCHKNVDFRGAPTECSICHSSNGLVGATAKSAIHIQSSEFCDACHTTTVWNDIIRVDHMHTIGACETCHNGITAEGKSPNHVFTTETCSNCHSDISWLPATFDHGNISSGCIGCHNGTTATGKSIDHIASQSNCETCHSTNGWLPAFVDHAEVLGNCSSCHNGIVATGKSANHFVTQQECDRCHTPTSWAADAFIHATPNYPGDHSGGLACTDCHINNSPVQPWLFSSYQPACAACHARDFQDNAHIKVLSPQIIYNVFELRDCSGACHIYTDATFSEILQTRPANHRVIDSAF